MFCPKCGYNNDEDANFCKKCGASLETPSKLVNTSKKSENDEEKEETSSLKIVIGICCVGVIFVAMMISGMVFDQPVGKEGYAIYSPSNTTQSDTSASTQPITLSGTGQEATQSFHLNGGLTRFNMTYNGGHNFIIHLMNTVDGSTQEYLVNEIGNFNGSRAFNVPAGDYILDVQASGPWKVIITQG